MKKIICLYGGPGCGKSTTMSLVFGLLKQLGKSGEMNPEYIKIGFGKKEILKLEIKFISSLKWLKKKDI